MFTSKSKLKMQKINYNQKVKVQNRIKTYEFLAVTIREELKACSVTTAVYEDETRKSTKIFLFRETP